MDITVQHKEFTITIYQEGPKYLAKVKDVGIIPGAFDTPEEALAEVRERCDVIDLEEKVLRMQGQVKRGKAEHARQTRVKQKPKGMLGRIFSFFKEG